MADKRNSWRGKYAFLALLLAVGMIPSVSAYSFTQTGTPQNTSSAFVLNQSFGSAGIQSFLLNITSTSTRTDPYDSCTVANQCFFDVRFDENTGKYVNDSSGNNINGTWFGNASNNWSETGKYNSAGNFSKVNLSYVKFPNNSTFDQVNKTFAFWFTTDGGATQAILAKQINASATGGGYYLTINTGTLVLNVYNSTGYRNSFTSSIGSFAAGIYYHLVIAFGLNNVELFENGISIGNLSTNGYSFATAQNFTLGAYSYTGTVNLNSVIDDFRAYNTTWNASQALNDYQLSPSQIQANTNSNSTKTDYWNSSSNNSLSIPFSASDLDISSISFTIPTNITQNGVVIYNASNNVANFVPSISINYNYTTNSNFGWNTIINNDYQNNIYLNNVFLAQNDFTNPLSNQNLTFNPANATWNISTGFTGSLYIGQLYPAGLTRFRFNVSVQRNDSNPYITINDGELFQLVVYGFATTQRSHLYYYNSTGALQTDKNFTITGNYTDLMVEQFANGTTVLTNNKDTTQSVSTKRHLDWLYPYNYISTPIIRINPVLNGGTSMNVTFYNFEEQVPRKLVSISSDNATFPFGFDGPRVNYSNGTDWLKQNNQRGTLWIGYTNFNNLNVSQKADVIDMVTNKGWEVGIHFTHSFTSLSYADAVSEMATDTTNVTTQIGKSPTSWVSLGNAENSTHAQAMWNNYSSLWRNAPDANIGSYSGIYAIYSASTLSADSNIAFWDIASQHKSFNPAYTHAVLTPLQEIDSANTSDFTRIMGNYTSSGIKIIPFQEWNNINSLSVTNITNVLFDGTTAKFNINTTGYNATTTIYDPNPGGNWIWYANGGWVKTYVSSSNITNLTINTPLNLTVQKANATFIPSSYDNYIVNVTTWNTTDDCKLIWTESSTNASVTTLHNITNPCYANKNVNILRDGVVWGTYPADPSGNLSFNYNGGYSQHQFEATADPIASSITAYYNNASGWNATSADVPKDETILFNATVNQTVAYISWKVDGTEVQNSSSLQLITAFNTRGTFNLTAQAFNTNGGSNIVYTIVTVGGGAGDNAIVGYPPYPTSYGSGGAATTASTASVTPTPTATAPIISNNAVNMAGAIKKAASSTIGFFGGFKALLDEAGKNKPLIIVLMAIAGMVFLVSGRWRR